MKFVSYNRETKLAIASMLSIFNNITIVRYTDMEQKRRTDSGKIKRYMVPTEYGNMNTIVKSKKSKGKNISLPMMSITREGESRDVDRVCDIHRGLTIARGNKVTTYNLQQNTPIPINIPFTLHIRAEYEEDLNQIIANFLPFFNPCVWIAMRNPMRPIELIRNQVLWDGSVNTNFNPEHGPEEKEYYEADVNFTFKTWHWFGEYDDRQLSSGIIKNIYFGDFDHTFYKDSNGNVLTSDDDITIIQNNGEKNPATFLQDNFIILAPDGETELHYNSNNDLVDDSGKVYITGGKVLKPIYNKDGEKLTWNDNKLTDENGVVYIDQLGEVLNPIYDENRNPLVRNTKTGDYQNNDGEIYYQQPNRVLDDEISNAESVKPVYLKVDDKLYELHYNSELGTLETPDGQVVIDPFGNVQVDLNAQPFTDEAGNRLIYDGETKSILDDSGDIYYYILDKFLLPEIVDKDTKETIAFINPYSHTITDDDEHSILENTNGIYGEIPTNSLGISGCFRDGFYIVNYMDTIDRVESLVFKAENHSDLPEHDEFIAYKDGDPEYESVVPKNGYAPNEMTDITQL